VVVPGRGVQATGLGLLGVLSFSLSLPATKAAVPALGAYGMGFGRSVVAASVAGLVLVAARAPFPDRALRRRLAPVVLGVVLGFPVLSAVAVAAVGSAHSAVIIGLLPAGTATCAVLRAGERPRLPFWLASGAGAVAVLAFASTRGAGLRVADLLLLGAVAAGGLGYAEGAVLSRVLPGWQVIGWALVLGLPLTVPLTGLAFALDRPTMPGASAWAGIAYMGVAGFVGFIPWYRGLALGGVARIGQLQLAQPVLTLGWSVWLLREHVDPATILAAAAVLACTAATQTAARTATPHPAPSDPTPSDPAPPDPAPSDPTPPDPPDDPQRVAAVFRR
jgi:drug/metabolite transporter (DMT)-like permease